MKFNLCISAVMILMLTTVTNLAQASLTTRAAPVAHVLIDGGTIHSLTEFHQTLAELLLLPQYATESTASMLIALRDLHSDTEIEITNIDALEKSLSSQDFEILIGILRDAENYDQSAAAKGEGFYLSVNLTVKS